MNLYQIDQALLDCQDPETGEILEEKLDELLALQGLRRDKLEGIALWVKNLKADISAMKAEIDVLTERKRKLTAKSEWLKQKLMEALDGVKMETPRCVVSFRKTKSVAVTDPKAFLTWATENGCSDFIRQKEPEISKSDVMAYLKEGYEAPGVALEEGLSVQIK